MLVIMTNFSNFLPTERMPRYLWSLIAAAQDTNYTMYVVMVLVDSYVSQNQSYESNLKILRTRSSVGTVVP